MAVHWSRIPKPKPCKQCGTVFTPSRVLFKFCTVECSKEHRRQYQEAHYQKREANKRLLSAVRTKPCAHCGEHFLVGGRARKYCGDECRSTVQIAQRKEHVKRQWAKKYKNETPEQRERRKSKQREKSRKSRQSVTYRIKHPFKEKQTKECLVCHRVFVAANPRHVSCSDACFKERMRRFMREYRKSGYGLAVRKAWEQSPGKRERIAENARARAKRERAKLLRIDSIRASIQFKETVK